MPTHKIKFNDKPKRPAGGDAREGNIPFYTQLAAFELKNKKCILRTQGVTSAFFNRLNSAFMHKHEIKNSDY